MTTYEQLQQDLEEYKCFSTSEQHPALQYAVKCISQQASYKMKLMMAASELVLFTSHLRKPILNSEGTTIPVNIFSFILAKSGASKDSSLHQIRAALSDAYELLETKRKEAARKKAEYKATVNDGEANKWRDYYVEPNALFVGIGTVEGQMAHWDNLQQNSYGGGFVIESELGSALINNKNMPENLEALSKVYDLGNIVPKIVKDKQFQTKAIHQLPISAIMFGTDEQILYNNTAKHKFKEEFISKLSRRSFVNFNTEEVPLPEYPSRVERLAAKKQILAEAKDARETISDVFVEIVKTTSTLPLELSAEAEDAYLLYMDYNEYAAKEVPHTHPITALHIRHRHWKAQKLAGALAILGQKEQIELSDMVYAIRFTELFTEDMFNFETELDKQPYELFSDYIRSLTTDEQPKEYMSIHQLRKLGYIKSSNSKVQLQELVTNASAYDLQGIYTVCDNGICYERIVKTPVSGVSYVKVHGTKEQRAKQCSKGFKYQESSFDKLEMILKGDFAYSPFEFKDGVRSKDNIIGAAKWVALDVDYGKITASEMHELLQDYNHHIALTSDASNDFKYRILLELDQFVDLDDKTWKYFTKSIADEFFIKLDNLPKSQIFFSYSAEEVLSVTQKQPLETRDHIIYALSQVNNNKPQKELTDKQRKALLSNAMDTFDYAYNLPFDGPGVRTLISVAFKAHELGATKDEIKTLLDDINNYWVDPLPKDRMEQQVYTILERL